MKSIDLQRLREIIEAVSTDEQAEINGTSAAFDEELAEQGQQLWWDGETYFIGPMEEEIEG